MAGKKKGTQRESAGGNVLSEATPKNPKDNELPPVLTPEGRVRFPRGQSVPMTNNLADITPLFDRNFNITKLSDRTVHPMLHSRSRSPRNTNTGSVLDPRGGI